MDSAYGVDVDPALVEILGQPHSRAESESGISWKYQSCQENWELHGVGSRGHWLSWAGNETIHVRKGQTEWRSWAEGEDTSITEDEVDESEAACRLSSFDTDRRMSEKVDVRADDRDGTPVTVAALERTLDYVLPGKEIRVSDELVFEVSPGRFVEYRIYYVEDGDWRLGARYTFEYLDELPEGVFEFTREFDPAP